MSEARLEILERLAKGEITAQAAEAELRKLEKDKGEKGFFGSFFGGLSNMDLCLDFRDSNRIVLEEEHTGTLAPGPVELDLEAVNGSIQVETWASQEYRLVIAKRVKAANLEEAEALAGEYKFARIDKNVINAGDPKCEKARRNISVSLHLYLPQGHTATGRGKTANGSIKITGLETSGLELSSGNGSIHTEDVSGGPISVRTVNGSVKAMGNTSQLTAKTTNGSVTLDSKALQSDTCLSTVNGSIKVTLPTAEDRAYSLTASTTCGRVSIDHPQFAVKNIGGVGGKYVETRSINWEQASHKIKLELNTVNGSIGIR